MSNFLTAGYVKLEKMLDPETIGIISQYFENKINRREWQQKELHPNDSSRYGYYADPLIEVFLKKFQCRVEQHTGLLLDPTYSFSRVYQGGESLKPHTDRPSCEISVTVNVACNDSQPWPIWMQYGSNDPVKCVLEPGDAVIYKGCDVTHWRTPLTEGCVNAQFMLHYVAKNGPNSQYKFDMRDAIGCPREDREV